MDDKARLIGAASDFALYPGVQNDASVKEFLDQFPLPLIINVLQTKSDEPGVENTIVSCLERVFKTKYGATLITDYMEFVKVGLTADSQLVKALACKTVTSLLENSSGTTLSSTRLINEYNIYPLLLGCLVNGDEEVAASSMDAIKALARLPEGLDIVFPTSSHEATHLGNLAASCTSLGRVRVLALLVKLFSISSSVASVIFSRNLLALLEDEIRNAGDTLVTLSALELWYELSEIQHATEILSRTTVLELLRSIISDESRESILRSRAMAITGRLMSEDKMYSYFDENSVRLVISAIDDRLDSSKTEDVNELESALEALGQIGSSTQGAILVLSSPTPAARHLTNAAFDRHGRGKQLAALHGLGNLVGETRPENSVLLSSEAEETLRHLVYDAASKSLKMTLSGLFLSIFQQEAEFRVAGYRVLCGLVARGWCLVEICSKPEIVDTITNPSIESSKIGMEVRYKCCKAMYEAFTSSKLAEDSSLAGIATKLEDGVRRGPYLTRTQRRQQEVQPLVVTADRF